jgi:regulator of replication initiation timing
VREGKALLKGSEEMSLTPYECKRFEELIRENEKLRLELEQLKAELEALKKSSK